jgi:DNA-binding NtrC family response regulator
MCLRRVVAVTRQADIQLLAKRVGKQAFVADDLSEALDIVETIRPDLIVLDDEFGPADTQKFIGATKQNGIDVPFVIVGGGANDPAISAAFMQIGAHDFLQGRGDYGRLRQIASEIGNRSNVGAIKNAASTFFVDECAARVGMVGRSRAFVKTLGMIRLVAASRCNPVLIVGETGTGKELAAKAIHALRHADGPFVAVNCATLTANLLESELFGHVKGSFTGADREKRGLLELAGAGTILLDEISEMPMNLQTKLLRVFQERTFRKVGGVKDVSCDATIMASSNRNLHKETKAHRFRRDLYYRLNICPVYIAPLRSADRQEDIPLLAEYFLTTSKIYPEKHETITSLTRLAIEALEKHDWPGNVRELCNVIERAILLETTDKIGLSSIVINPAEGDELSQDSTAANIKDFSLVKAERELIIRALQETGGVQSQAAGLLGITRQTLADKVKRYGIKKGQLVAEAVRDEVPAASSHEPVMAG